MEYKAMISDRVQERLRALYGMENAPVALEVPPSEDMGDYALPCFPLAKALRKAPQAIAQELAGSFGASDVLREARAVGGYVNFFVDPARFAADVLGEIGERGDKYGAKDEGHGGVVCLDYSSINITKQFHYGHLMTTAIGNSLKRLYEFLGYRTVSINHLGDWGTQFGKQIVAYKRWGNDEILQNGTPSEAMQELTRIYVKFHKEAETNPELEVEARAWFKRIEDGEPEAMRLFAWFKDLTLRDCMRVYDMLDVKFDSYAGESFYIDKMQPVLDELADKGLLVESQGAQVVDLEAYGMPPCLLVKSDGATLYHTRDIAAALYRKKEYDFVKSLYVVAMHQELHFRQLFQVLKLMGRDWVDECEHVSYGMVSLEDGEMSTRRGNVVLLEDLLDRAIAKTKEIMLEKSPDLPDIDEAARQVGVGALVFQVLLNNRMRDVVFSWDRALNFDGETGPYVHYTHARCCSVLRKAGEAAIDIGGEFDAARLTDAHAMSVVRLLERFPSICLEARRRNEPSLITRYAVDLAQAFNRFYFECRILDDDPATAKARLRLTAAVRQVLRTALGLLGIAAPERM